MVFSFNHQDISFTSEIPHVLSRYILPGSHVSVIQNDCLKMLMQQFEASGSRMYYTVYLTDRKCDLQVKEEGAFFMTYIALQQDRHFDLEEIGKIQIREGQYNILYSPRFDLTNQYEPNREYLTLAIHYDSSLLDGWSQYFPALSSFLQKVTDGIPAVLLPESGWMTREIHETIHRILHTDQQDPAQKIYFELLVKTLLFHLLNQSVQQQPASKYSHYEVEGIQAAGEMIRKNLRYHFVIREIAQKVGMNEFKLKNGFRELFGNGVYEYLRIERMQQARNLLEERGRSIKEIAALTGYRSVNSFIKAFKKKFGKTPGEFRKRA